MKPAIVSRQATIQRQKTVNYRNDKYSQHGHVSSVLLYEEKRAATDDMSDVDVVLLRPGTARRLNHFGLACFYLAP